jgi:hypothetical protein
MANGDRAYVRNSGGALITTGKGQPASYRIFRDATPSRIPSPGKSGLRSQVPGQCHRGT